MLRAFQLSLGPLETEPLHQIQMTKSLMMAFQTLDGDGSLGLRDFTGMLSDSVVYRDSNRFKG